MRTFDILTVTDFRLPGGTNHSTKQELAIQASLGLYTGLVQANSKLSSRALPWSSMIVEELGNRVAVVRPGEKFSARLAILRHPTAILEIPDLSKSGTVDQAIIVANQPAIKPNGGIEYDVRRVSEIVRNRLGVNPSWAPIGPVVRRTLEPFAEFIDLLPYDWTNVFAQPGLPLPRTHFNSIRPRIGRHSRPQPAKWPDSATDILNAYPVRSDFDVRILGGAKPALNLIGKKPANWTVHAFGAMDPMEFLDDVDFWVYFHHPGWSEAYGRAIMEALWSGAVAILPEYLRVSYGDSAVYGKPEDVTAIIEDFSSGRRDFLKQSRLGQAFAAEHAAEVHEGRIAEIFTDATARHSANSQKAVEPVTVTELSTPQTRLPTSRERVVDRFAESPRPRALFITSNGAGMGHLTRMLGLARAAAHKFEPVFFSMSQGVSVVGSAGFPYEYVPFNSAMQTKSALWHKYFEDRLRQAIHYYNVELVIFDGTWPYRGMLNVLQSEELLRVWVRRGMWKPTISSGQLSKAPEFDLVIEPGEHAHSYDTGATSRDGNSSVVNPMTVMSRSELLSREEALLGLGLRDEATNKCVLVTLGAGNINDLSSTQTDVLSAINSEPGWEAIVTKAPIAKPGFSGTTRTVSTFPLAKYTRAFEFAVSAAGYNSFAEWMSGGLPAVWIPNMSTMTDDQDARARWAADNGYGLRAMEDDPGSIFESVRQMCLDDAREDIRARLGEIDFSNGAQEAASLLESAWIKHERAKGRTL